VIIGEIEVFANEVFRFEALCKLVDEARSINMPPESQVSIGSNGKVLIQYKTTGIETIQCGEHTGTDLPTDFLVKAHKCKEA
jgi:hypothetical protein